MTTRQDFKSDEEWYFYLYLEELKKQGQIRSMEISPQSFKLSDAIKYNVNKKDKALLQEHIYTPDFEIIWEAKAVGKFIGERENYLKFKSPFYSNVFFSSIEVKPLWDMNNMQRLFSINQKWVFSKYGIYVQKIIPQQLFEKTFTPAKVIEYAYFKKGSKKGKPKWKITTYEEYCK